MIMASTKGFRKRALTAVTHSCLGGAFKSFELPLKTAGSGLESTCREGGTNECGITCIYH